MKKIITIILLVLSTICITAQGFQVFHSTHASYKATDDIVYSEIFSFESDFAISQDRIVHLMDHATGEFYISLTFTTEEGNTYQCVDMNNQVVTITANKMSSQVVNGLYLITVDYSKAKDKKYKPRKECIMTQFWAYKD